MGFLRFFTCAKMFLYFVPSLNTIRSFSIEFRCHEVFEHERRLQADPYVMAVRGLDYWAFECTKEIDVETAQKFLKDGFHESIQAAYDAKNCQWYGSPSEEFRFNKFPFPLIPDSLLTLFENEETS